MKSKRRRRLSEEKCVLYLGEYRIGSLDSSSRGEGKEMMRQTSWSSTTVDIGLKRPLDDLIPIRRTADERNSFRGIEPSNP
jgi:hypothetical protein